MPPPSSRMTKQPARPVRYFPGKAYADDPVSDDESEDEEEGSIAKAPPPKATSFPKKLAVDIGKSAGQPLPRPPESTKEDALEGFVTASESSGEDGEEASSDEDDESSEEKSSSDDEPKKPMLAPKFISKAKRAQQQTAAPIASLEQQAAEDERKRREKADELLQAQIERETAARKAGKKYWDDDDIAGDGEVDDRDGLDPEAERAAWKLRELKRVQRDRQALVAKEKERGEVERRRNLTAEDRDKEDREYLEKQAETRKDKGKMGYMQKYFHNGAFFQAEGQDPEVQQALNRGLAGRKFVDDAGDKAVLPEYMRIRDMTRLGKKGRTKYKDLKDEDTGQWGRIESRKREFDGLDERFRPDEREGGSDRSGANAAPIGERRRRDDDGGRDEKRARYD